jgi:uncharacterized protein
MSRGTRLLDLQGVENALRDKISAYKKIQKELTLDSPARQARLAYEEAEKNEKAARARQQSLNLEWQSLIQRVDTEEKRLYSGEITNPKELYNLQLEVEMLKKQREKLENQALTLIEEVDRLAQETAVAKEAYERIEADTRSHQAELEKRENKLKRDISTTKREREKLIEDVGSGDLEQYRYVQRLKNDTYAVAAMEDGVCGACHIEVSAAKRAMVETSPDTLITCGNCGRILVV